MHLIKWNVTSFLNSIDQVKIGNFAFCLVLVPIDAPPGSPGTTPSAPAESPTNERAGVYLPVAAPPAHARRRADQSDARSEHKHLVQSGGRVRWWRQFQCHTGTTNSRFWEYLKFRK